MPSGARRAFSCFFSGDVMTGRGIDHILRHPSAPALQEPYVQDARTYVELAEAASGPIPRGVDDAYIWGDALEELDRMEPDARVVNLETTVTRSDDAWPKLINYRMHPANVGCFTAAKLDVCVLANNHVLDYGYAGLCETLETLTSVGLKVAGAGLSQEEARRPARVRIADGRNLIVFGFGAETSGIPASWAASHDRPGVDLLSHLSEATAAALLDRVARVKRPGDLVVVSIHWGGNWGYAIPGEHVQFAHWLVDGGVDLVHGHSSHHPRGIEVYADRLILYGCGDCINDYEGIAGYEQFRGDLVLMYFATLGPAGDVTRLRMRPMQVKRMRLGRVGSAEAAWLAGVLNSISARFGSRVELTGDGALELRWAGQ